MIIYHDTAARRFYAQADGVTAGLIAYEPDADGNLRAVETRVEPAFSGQGLAGQLLDALVEYAMSSGVKIIPVCSYVAHAFEKKPEKYGAVSPL